MKRTVRAALAEVGDYRADGNTNLFEALALAFDAAEAAIDSPLARACREGWEPGQFYKLRAILRQSNFGPQLEIKKIRPVEDADRDDGFDPLMCQPTSRFDPVEMFAELMNIVEGRIVDEPLRSLVSDVLEQHREALLTLPAARRNHHAFVSGFLEHVLNVTRTCCHLADKYAELYRETLESEEAA